MHTLHVIPHADYHCYRPATGEALPTVLHMAGFNEDARSHAPFALRLAAAGWQCLALEPPWRNTPALHSPSPAILFDLMAEADALLERVLAALPGADASRLALTGFSMGGLWVARVLAAPRSHPFRAAAMALATGDWSFMPRAALDTFPDLQAAVPPDMVALAEEVLRQQSPIATPDRFPPTPLLQLNTDRDPRLPLAAAQRFHDALRPAYDAAAVPNALHFHIHQGDRHEFRRAMQRQVRDWLGEMLNVER